VICGAPIVLTRTAPGGVDGTSLLAKMNQASKAMQDCNIIGSNSDAVAEV
jgi:hypothetical protein